MRFKIGDKVIFTNTSRFRGRRGKVLGKSHIYSEKSGELVDVKFDKPVEVNGGEGAYNIVRATGIDIRLDKNRLILERLDHV